jgi:hypothetical protein
LDVMALWGGVTRVMLFWGEETYRCSHDAKTPSFRKGWGRKSCLVLFGKLRGMGWGQRRLSDFEEIELLHSSVEFDPGSD